MRWGYTVEQIETMRTKADKLTEMALQGTQSFGLSSYQCKKYLNISNETFHQPMCYVKDTRGDEVYVEAIFFGSGLLSHPIRRGWMPKSEVRVNSSNTRHTLTLIGNYIMSFFVDLEFYDRDERTPDRIKADIEFNDTMVRSHYASLSHHHSQLSIERKSLATYEGYVKRDIETHGEASEPSLSLVDIASRSIELYVESVDDYQRKVTAIEADTVALRAELLEATA